MPSFEDGHVLNLPPPPPPPPPAVTEDVLVRVVVVVVVEVWQDTLNPKP